jgi:predicted transcriptional regulator of viral defense system
VGGVPWFRCMSATYAAVDRRCCIVVHSLMTSLEERGLARRHKRGTYLIERAAVEEVLTALRQWI